MAERLQKLISAAGIASRRDAEVLIEQGRVTVNGKRATLGDKADPAVDDVRVDGERITISAERMYIMLNKPRQVVTTVRAQDQEERDTVRDLVPVEGHLYPVGRLDADSEGLVLLTNDGELAERLTHPRYHHAKIYEVTVHGHMRDDVLDIWRRGVVLDDGKTAPVEIKVLRRESRFTQLQITMHEGRKRQIRRIGNTLGHPVESILRTHLGTLELGNLKPGEWRYLTDAEVRALRASAMSGPAFDEPNRPGWRAVRQQRHAAARTSRTGYKRGEPGRRDGESRAPRSGRPGQRYATRGRSEGGESRGGDRPFQRDYRRRDEGGGPSRSDRPDRPEREPRSGGRRAEGGDRAPRDRNDRDERDQRGPMRGESERRPFRTRRDTGAENTERREQRPRQRTERGDRPDRGHGPSPRRFERDQNRRDQAPDQERSRPPRDSRRPPDRDPRGGPDRGSDRRSDRGPGRPSNSGRPGGPGRGPGPRPGSGGGGRGGRPGGPRGGSGGSGRRSGGSGGSSGGGSGNRSGGRGPRRGGR